MNSPRIDVRSARARVAAGALLVSAYADEEKYRRYHLHGSISLGELEQRLPQLERDQEIIFYCA